VEIVLKNLALTGEKKKTGKRLPVFYVLLVAKTTPGIAGGPKELIARKGVDNKKTPH